MKPRYKIDITVPKETHAEWHNLIARCREEYPMCSERSVLEGMIKLAWNSIRYNDNPFPKNSHLPTGEPSDD